MPRPWPSCAVSCLRTCASHTDAPASRVSVLKEALDGARHVLALLDPQLGKDGQRQHLGRCALGLAKVAAVVTQREKARLLVQTTRVVPLAADLRRLQRGAQLVPPRRA